MILKDLKQQMLIPREEYIINKRVNIQGVDVLLLGFTIEDDYLDAKPIVHKSASSVGLILGSKDAKLGVNGYKIRECILQPIDKDFSGQLEIELFSRFFQIPEETINT